MKSIRILLIACVIIATSSKVVLTQDHQHDGNSKVEMKKETTSTNDIIRKGVINLKAIDKNKDGKVFQDMMDWNVISDKAGKCPLCKMMLKEVTIKEAKEYLIKNGFKVK